MNTFFSTHKNKTGRAQKAIDQLYLVAGAGFEPSGYEPDELPDCSTPRLKKRSIAYITREYKLAYKDTQ